MKTWTNPSVEELEVEMTAAHIFSVTPEEWGNGTVDWTGGQIVGDCNNGGNNGGDNGGDNGGEPGGDIIIGQGS